MSAIKCLDDKIKELAITDWQTFMEIAGPDFVVVVKTRVLRNEGKSWREISMKLGITPAQARTNCKSKNS
jgi:hypothetical protein